MTDTTDWRPGTRRPGWRVRLDCEPHGVPTPWLLVPERRPEPAREPGGSAVPSARELAHAARGGFLLASLLLGVASLLLVLGKDGLADFVVWGLSGGLLVVAAVLAFGVILLLGWMGECVFRMCDALHGAATPGSGRRGAER